MIRISRIELNSFGLWKFMFAGEFADTVFSILTTVIEALIEMGHEYLVDKVSAAGGSRRSTKMMKRALHLIQQM